MRFHEMGVHDLPAIIDHVLNTTNQRQLFYIGHSMGTTTFYVLASMRPEYNAKIRLAVQLAPSAFLPQIRVPILQPVLKNFKLFYLALKAVETYEYMPRTRRLQLLLGRLCAEGSRDLPFCLILYRGGFGLNRRTFDIMTSHILFSHLLSGASINSVAHFVQNHITGRFQMFDPTINIGKNTPEYNLSRVSAPVFLVYGQNDEFAHPKGLMQLRTSLPNLVLAYRVPDAQASHMDFVFSKHVKRDIYDEVLKVMNQFR